MNGIKKDLSCNKISTLGFSMVLVGTKQVSRAFCMYKPIHDL